LDNVVTVSKPDVLTREDSSGRVHAVTVGLGMNTIDCVSRCARSVSACDYERVWWS